MVLWGGVWGLPGALSTSGRLWCPLPPVGRGCGNRCFQFSLMAGQSHALHHGGPALHQNATSACTALVQTPTKLCQASPLAGLPLISLGKPRNLLAWPCPALARYDITAPPRPGLRAGTYMCCVCVCLCVWKGHWCAIVEAYAQPGAGLSFW